MVKSIQDEPASANRSPLTPLTKSEEARVWVSRAVRYVIHPDPRPWLWGLGAGVIAWYRFPNAPAAFDKLAVEVLPTAVTVAAMLAGLISMSQSILLALLDRPVIAYLKREGYYPTLIGYHRAAYRTQLLFIAASLIVMALRSGGFRLASYERIVPAVLAFLAACAWSSTTRQMSLMFKLLEKKDGPET
jgi:hypothetical protein